MLRRSARRLLESKQLVSNWNLHNEIFLRATGSSLDNNLPESTPALIKLCRDLSLNGDFSGYQKGIPGNECSWKSRSYSSRGFRTVEALQQGMTEVVHDVVPLPSDIRAEDLMITRSDHLQVRIQKCNRILQPKFHYILCKIRFRGSSEHFEAVACDILAAMNSLSLL